MQTICIFLSNIAACQEQLMQGLIDAQKCFLNFLRLSGKGTKLRSIVFFTLHNNAVGSAKGMKP